MRRFVLFVLVFFAVSCAPYETVGPGTYFGFTVGVANVPPPPSVVFVNPPAYVWVPGTSVAVVENSPYDLFQYGSTYYMTSGGYWYRAPRYGGPYAAVDVRTVPRAILTVPGEHWKHPPYAGRSDRDGRDRDDDRDHHDRDHHDRDRN